MSAGTAGTKGRLFRLSPPDRTGLMFGLGLAQLLALGILAKFENSVAMAERWSIWSISVRVMRCRFSFSIPLPPEEVFCRCCTLNFMGVRGFLTS